MTLELFPATVQENNWKSFKKISDFYLKESYTLSQS